MQYIKRISVSRCPCSLSRSGWCMGGVDWVVCLLYIGFFSNGKFDIFVRHANVYTVSFLCLCNKLSHFRQTPRKKRAQASRPPPIPLSRGQRREVLLAHFVARDHDRARRRHLGEARRHARKEREGALSLRDARQHTRGAHAAAAAALYLPSRLEHVERRGEQRCDRPSEAARQEGAGGGELPVRIRRFEAPARVKVRVRVRIGVGVGGRGRVGLG